VRLSIRLQAKPEKMTARATKRFAAQALMIVFTVDTEIPTARISGQELREMKRKSLCFALAAVPDGLGPLWSGWHPGWRLGPGRDYRG
jgi:hypothetical protein